MLGQMPQNGLRGHDSLYENMISMDLQESAPEYTIWTFLARCPRTASEAMILSTNENMISIDLQESAPEYTIYTFLARCPRTASKAMILFTKT